MASYSSRLPAIGGRRDRAAQRTNHPLNNRPRRPSLLDAQAEADALAARPALRRHRDARGLPIGPRVALHRPSSSFWWCCCLYQCPYQNFKLPSLTSSVLDAAARGRREGVISILPETAFAVCWMPRSIDFISTGRPGLRKDSTVVVGDAKIWPTRRRRLCTT